MGRASRLEWPDRRARGAARRVLKYSEAGLRFFAALAILVMATGFGLAEPLPQVVPVESPAGAVLAELEAGHAFCGLNDGGLLAPRHARPGNAGGMSAAALSLPAASKQVDILMLYTTEAKEAYGGEEGMQRLASAHVGHANSTFSASGIAVQLRLVHLAETTWHKQNTYPNHTAELFWLAADPAAARLREETGADLVSLITKDLRGTAFLLDAFSIVGNNSTVFTHEIGHNFGAQHDQPNANGCSGCKSYSYGYVFQAGGLRYGDIMAYAGLRFPLFSNPLMTWQGEAAGTATADNARAINEVAAEVAGWRAPKTPGLQNAKRVPPGFAFELAGPSSAAGKYAIEYTEDYRTWTRLAELTHTGRNTGFTDLSAERGVARRFYRAVRDGVIASGQVGFVRKTLPPGFSMVGNPLDRGDNRIAALWANPPSGVVIHKFDAERQVSMPNEFKGGAWENPDMSVAPGEGVIVENTSGAEVVLEFIGQVRSAFSVHIYKDWSIVSSPVPEAGRLSSVLGFPRGQAYGDRVRRMADADGSLTTYVSMGDFWAGGPDPVIELGEAFWVYKPGWMQESAEQNWARVFLAADGRRMDLGEAEAEMRLAIEKLDAGYLRLSWPETAEAWALEATSALGPNAYWVAVEMEPVPANGRLSVEMPADAGFLAFRLVK